MRFRRRPGVGPSRATIAAVTAVAAATLIAACSSSSSSGGSSSSTSSGATAASSASAAAMTPIGVDLTYNNTAFWAAYINYENQYAAQLQPESR